MKNANFSPESLMMSYAYRPELSEGSLKCPIFQTSTFVFSSAEQGKAHFELAYGLRQKNEGEEPGLIYSRINNPDLQILEERLCLWDKAEAGAVFESGMSAIATTFMELLQPGDLLLFSNPLYGGTDHFVRHFLTRWGVNVLGFHPEQSEAEIAAMVEASGMADRLAMIYLETPANPTNTLIDIQMCRRLADRYSNPEKTVLVAVDNTYLGPLWQHPLQQGADLVLYSATKYIGGHSDVIAGAVLGNNELIGKLKVGRTFFGNMAGPWTGWLLMRSLETLKLRMEEQCRNAQKIAQVLNQHPQIQKVHYLGLLQESDGEQYEIYQRQCLSPGAMIAFEIKGSEAEAFRFLNGLRLVKLAVSLGGTESLAQHPASMTHAGVSPEDKVRLGIHDGLVRLSIGVENVNDLLFDIKQALEKTAVSQTNQVVEEVY
ncbi:MAG: methionine gamma-lyase [Saprospiraceae bacterium]|nr:MAG: methionine gamma-lyase [Saprospiraceae bacterium]